MAGLTQRQADLLAFITKFDAENGISPSFQQMADGCGLSSKSGVHRLLSVLVAKGKVKRLRYRARSIEVITGSELAHVPVIELRRELMRRAHAVTSHD